MAIKPRGKKKSTLRKRIKERVPVESGNIDVKKRRAIKNKDKSVSTVRTIGINVNGLETVIPTIGPKGERFTDKQAIKHFKKTGKQLGKFKTRGAASDFARELSASQALRLKRKARKSKKR